MKKILITGSTGFIGRNLVEYFENKNYEVLHPNHQELDLTVEESVREYLLANQPIDLLIHSANANMRSTDGYDILNTSLRMYYNLEKNSELYGRMFYLGSGAVYGRYSLPPKVKENQFGISVPKDSYGFTKYIVHQSISWSYNIYELILFGVFGKYEDYNRRFISNNIVNKISGTSMTLKQDAMFDYIYINDFAQIIESMWKIDLHYKHYNVCTGKAIALSELANIINKVSGYETELIVKETGWSNEYSGDNTRLIDEIGNFRFTPFTDSISDMWQYYNRILLM